MPHERLSLFGEIAGRVIPKSRESQIALNINLIEYPIQFSNLPESLNGKKIAHISDDHNINLFEKRPDLYQSLLDTKPDYIFISGDSLTNHKYRNAIETIKLTESIPSVQEIDLTYGNHESNSGRQVKPFSRQLLDETQKVTILRNYFHQIGPKEDNVFIVGIDDPNFYGYGSGEKEFFRKMLEHTIKNVPDNAFIILISHRPEMFDIYSDPQYNIKLVFSGHAHGGQWEIPIIKRRIFAPNQGLFPKYTHGVYHKNETHMVVSEGIANDFIAPRTPGSIPIIILQNEAS